MKKRKNRHKKFLKKTDAAAALSYLPHNVDDNIDLKEAMISPIAKEEKKPVDIEQWMAIKPPKRSFLKLTQWLTENRIKPDVRVHIDTETFKCHMTLMRSYSDYFMNLRNQSVIVLPPKKVKPSTFEKIYAWMWAENPVLERDSLAELLVAAKFLHIKDLVQQCWWCLDGVVSFTEHKAFTIFLEARDYRLYSCQQMMATRINKSFLPIVASRKFLGLRARELCILLKSSTIGVNSEMEILMCIVRWLDHNWVERAPELASLIKQVRFKLMPKLFLKELKQNMVCEQIKRVISHPIVQKLVNDAIIYAGIQTGRNRRKEYLGSLKPKEKQLTQRWWIYDTRCNYHHRQRCSNMHCITYEDFLNYLKMLRDIGKDSIRSIEISTGVESGKECCAHVFVA